MCDFHRLRPETVQNYKLCLGNRDLDYNQYEQIPEFIPRSEEIFVEGSGEVDVEDASVVDVTVDATETVAVDVEADQEE